MNVSAIGTYSAPPLGRMAQHAPVAAPHAAPATAADAGRIAGAEIPVEAPQGTDAQLWSVLTSQERSHFGRADAARSVTYGPGGGSNLAALRGQSLDLRV